MIKCKICNDAGVVEGKEPGRYVQCKCIKEMRVISTLEKTGLGAKAIQKSFNDFESWNSKVSEMKEIAVNYFIFFDKIKDTKYNSIALFGESGSGKTHLLLALIRNFVIKKYLNVVYMSYIDGITELKQNIINGEVYQKTIKRYKYAEVLVIDDLFKNGNTESDLRIIIEIINYRYVNRLPVMFSSEYLLGDIIIIDKAIGGRIKEMSEDYIYEIEGIENNYRMK